MTLIRVIVTILLLGQLDAVRHASVQFEIKKNAIHNAFRKRRWVAEKFLSGGNADGMTYLQYMFDEFKSTGDDFRRAFRVTRQVFSHLEARLGVKDMPEPLNFDWAPAWFFAERSPALARSARPLNYELLSERTAETLAAPEELCSAFGISRIGSVEPEMLFHHSPCRAPRAHVASSLHAVMGTNGN